jgi:signal transduction histidine kinase
VRPFRSVGAQLSAAFVLVAAIALALVYGIVVPRLERNLTEARLDSLERSGELAASEFRAVWLRNPLYEIDLADYLSEVANASAARVVVVEPLGPRALRVIEDTRKTELSEDVADDPVALRAALSLAPARDIVTRGGERIAEVAFPLTPTGTALLFSASLEDNLADVQLVERRLLVAGGIALLVALVLGYGGASLFARRIRRLERAADRIAGGRLDEPVRDRGSDELGQLAAAFERMRLRLAQLEHARREFIANASHELRTPIFALGGFLELLDDPEVDQETRAEFLATMQGQVERLTKLATELLDLSRLDAGQLRIEAEAVDLAALAGALADEFSAIARTGGHTLSVAVPADAPTALADAQRVLQIGRVLVENALRHTLPGTAIRIRVARDGGQAFLAVEDEGSGIPAEHAHDVFERFFRLDGALASGSGLGLAIARELAHAMGGTLDLESRPGRTLFSLALPLSPLVQPPRQPLHVKSEPSMFST